MRKEKTIEAYREINRQESLNSVMTYRFEEEDFAYTYYLEDYYCTNPFCDCQHVTVSFRDQEDESNRISFLLNFTGKASPLPNQPKLTKNQAEIVRNFAKDIPKELIVLFKQRYAEAKAHGEKDSGSYLVFESGRYVNYLEFFPKTKELLEFVLNDKKYFAEDGYEMDPRSDNRDVQLNFFQLDMEAMDKQSPEFTYKFFLNEEQREKTDSVLTGDQGAMVMAFTASNSNLDNLFKDRYRKVKEIGEKLLKQAPKKTFMDGGVHRNEACPCGSGKKFKRCCGTQMN